MSQSCVHIDQLHHPTSLYPAVSGSDPAQPPAFQVPAQPGIFFLIGHAHYASISGSDSALHSEMVFLQICLPPELHNCEKLPQMFIEHLLCVRCCSMHWGHSMSNMDINTHNGRQKMKTRQVGTYTLLAGDQLMEETAARKESGVQWTQGAWLQFSKERTLEQRYEGGEGRSGPGRRCGRNEGLRAGGGERRV